MRMSYWLAGLIVCMAVGVMLVLDLQMERKAECEAEGGDWTRHGYGKRAWYGCEH